MDAGGDWWVWPLAFGVGLLFVVFFAVVAKTMFLQLRSLIGLVQNWPQYRRQLVEQEARACGRHPWWYRALRVFFILAALAIAAYSLWRRFG